jgi:hypothetical protein
MTDMQSNQGEITIAIEWGSRQSREENKEDDTERIERYTFATEEELKAFLTGVDVAVGWHGCLIREASGKLSADFEDWLTQHCQHRELEWTSPLAGQVAS